MDKFIYAASVKELQLCGTAADISQEEADREVLKLEQHITAIKSFKDFYVK